MITDQSRRAGLGAYFRNPSAAADVNLGPIAPVSVRTAPLPRGRQLDVSGIRLLLEHADLAPLFQFRLRTGTGLQPIRPMLRVTVMKEMFAGLFADPFRHRVHNIAGYLDFNEGRLENARVVDVDGVPTIVSMGTGLCRWVSRRYELPDPASIVAAAWELATSRLSPPDAVTYSLRLDAWDASGSGPISIDLALARDLGAGRFADDLSLQDATFFQLTFEAHVTHQAALVERHTPIVLQSIGTPLLRAINLLEPIASIYDIYSLTELAAESSDFRVHETPGPAIVRCLAHLDVPAVLVHSPNQIIANDDLYDSATRYEFVELQVNRPLDRFEARLTSHEQTRDVR